MALQFTSTVPAAYTGVNLTSNAAYSVHAYVNVTTIQKCDFFYAQTISGYFFSTWIGINAGQLIFWDYDSGAGPTHTQALSTATPYSLALVCDNTNFIAYVDGAQVFSTPYVLPIARANFTAADTGSDSNATFQAQDVAVWSRALSPAEVLALHQQRYTAALLSGLYLWCPMPDATTPTSARADYSGNGHDIATTNNTIVGNVGTKPWAASAGAGVVSLFGSAAVSAAAPVTPVTGVASKSGLDMRRGPYIGRRGLR